MARHFFLCAAVPELSVEQKPAIDFDSFIFMLELSCTKGEWRLVRSLREFFDLMNLQATFFQRPLQPYGNVQPDDFEDHLRQRLSPNHIVIDYLDRYSSVKQRRERFSQLVASFFEEKKKERGFVGEYFAWLEEFFIVGAAVRAKRLGRDIAKELSDEDFSHPRVLESLAFRDAVSYDPPEAFAPVREIYERDFENPKQLEKNTTQFIFQHLEAIKELRPFTLDYLLAYMVQLILVEHLWPAKDEPFDFEKLLAS